MVRTRRTFFIAQLAIMVVLCRRFFFVFISPEQIHHPYDVVCFGLVWSFVSFSFSWTVKKNSKDFLGMQLDLDAVGIDTGLKPEEKKANENKITNTLVN